MEPSRVTSKPGRPRGAPYYVTAHVALYRATGGIIGGRGGPLRFLLLTTSGRRTGRPHTVPLPFYLDDGTPYVVASNYGNDYPPAWYLNLVSHPEVTIQIGRARYPARARIAGPDERARIWSRLTTHRRNYARYQQRTNREIPLVLLERDLQSQ